MSALHPSRAQVAGGAAHCTRMVTPVPEPVGVAVAPEHRSSRITALVRLLVLKRGDPAGRRASVAEHALVRVPVRSP